LTRYIVIEGQKLTKTIKKGLTDAITGGQFNTTHRVTKTYPANELFIDVVEKVNLLVSNKGNVLQHEIQGEVKVKVRPHLFPTPPIRQCLCYQPYSGSSQWHTHVDDGI